MYCSVICCTWYTILLTIRAFYLSLNTSYVVESGEMYGAGLVKTCRVCKERVEIVKKGLRSKYHRLKLVAELLWLEVRCYE